VGLVVGLVLSCARVMSLLDEPVGGQTFVSQAEFERKLWLPAVMGRNRVEDISVRRAGAVDLVSLGLLSVVTLEYRDRQFAAPRPYTALVNAGAGTKEFPSVREYLAFTYPSVEVARAWWDEPGGIFTLWTGGSVVSSAGSGHGSCGCWWARGWGGKSRRMTWIGLTRRRKWRRTMR
jgi:hypothetical protein